MDTIMTIAATIYDLLNCQEYTSDDIVNHISIKHFGIYKKEICKNVIKYCWESGNICYVNKNSNWNRENRYFGLTKNYYPNLDLNMFEEKEAQRLLVLAHVKNYGPVTIKDIMWWSGLNKQVIKRCLMELNNDIVAVNINGFDNVCFMEKISFEKYQDFNETNLEWMELLAYEDSSLKGYFETRFRYVDEKYYDRLFNQIGEVRASILYNGVAIGTWYYNLKAKKIVYSIFDNYISTVNYRLLENKIYDMEKYLFGEHDSQLKLNL